MRVLGPTTHDTLMVTPTKPHPVMKHLHDVIGNSSAAVEVYGRWEGVGLVPRSIPILGFLGFYKKGGAAHITYYILHPPSTTLVVSKSLTFYVSQFPYLCTCTLAVFFSYLTFRVIVLFLTLIFYVSRFPYLSGVFSLI